MSWWSSRRDLRVVRLVGNAMEQATQLFDGVGGAECDGRLIATSSRRPGACCPVRLSELDAHRVVDARFDQGVLMVLAVKDGQYDRFVFRFNSGLRTYDARILTNVSCSNVEFVGLDTGSALALAEGDDLEVFPCRRTLPGSGSSRMPAFREHNFCGTGRACLPPEARRFTRSGVETGSFHHGDTETRREGRGEFFAAD